MKKEDCEARTLIALVVGVGFGVIIGVAALTVAYPVFRSESWASWIQAVGTIAAVFSGFLLNAHQRNAKERERLDLLLSGLREIHKHVQSYTLVTLERTRDGAAKISKTGVYDVERLDFCVKYLSEIGFSDFPCYMAYSLNDVINKISSGVKRYKALYENAEEYEKAISYYGGPGSDELEVLNEAIKEIEKRKSLK
ncbi:hypothetical protein I7E32_13100 [Alcaligenes faecalis]|uniref:hypothetical protein n=1 Tax=Alcaligenes faecalis TaxID=511 RepID=UPI0018D1990D|nr:hypothetical protein [Alcaligenes faecalis]MBH0311302.1 hypothetical protein [Alcaligenes faecalis]